MCQSSLYKVFQIRVQDEKHRYFVHAVKDFDLISGKEVIAKLIPKFGLIRIW